MCILTISLKSNRIETSISIGFTDAEDRTIRKGNNNEKEKHSNANDQGLKENFYGVLRAAAETDCPLYYIVEHSFHTNPAVAGWLMIDSNLPALAVAVAAAIDNYLKS